MKTERRQLHPRLQAIYDLFKPMPETKVWGDAVHGVCVSHEYAGGYMRWWMENDRLKFQWMDTTRSDYD